MSTLASAGSLLASAISGGFVLKLLDTWAARRAAKDKRTETTSQADATVKTKRIDDAAALRGELWDRITKLEAKQEQCAKENGELREEIGKLRSDIEVRDSQIDQRDSVIFQLTRDVQELRGRAERAEQKAADAERRTNALHEELVAFRKAVA
jgi:predicted RNase H-like nuclease (RuvC/YqgF family)